MKKVGLMTIYDCNNYGASLQAYATTKNLEELGFDYRIVNYITPSDKRLKKFFLFPKNRRYLMHNVKALLNPVSFFRRNKTFNSFVRNSFKITDKEYTLADYKKIADEDFDFLVTGSDQTFSLNLWPDPEYGIPFFMPFETKCKKISYSSSMGEHLERITDSQISFMKETLSDFEHLAVREETAANAIEKMIGKRPVITFDPTITLSRDKWEKLEKPFDIKEKYIFFYGVLPTKWITEYVEKLSKETGFKVVTPNIRNTTEMKTDFKRVDYCGPGEFLTLIKNAEMVVTSSFHGTIFSMIYEKPFASLLIGSGNRVTTLLKLAGMEEFAFKENDNVIVQKPDPEKIKAFQKSAKETNYNYLKNSLTD